MKFNELDTKMRKFEQSLDQFVTPDVYIIARLDGRGFTRLTKETLSLECPFDICFRDAMLETTKHLMDCGFNMSYGYTESDEISLLFQKDESSFGRKTRKLVSILAGEASATFSMNIGSKGVFDCRIVPLPNEERVIDYFRWRAEDANRNALNAYCYWKWREKGETAPKATQILNGMTTAEKNEMLFQQGVNYNQVPSWQKRGIALYYKTTKKDSVNPINNNKLSVNRRTLVYNQELPLNLEYTTFLQKTLFTKEKK
jgi:tRNA(His) guanylyltransferase